MFKLSRELQLQGTSGTFAILGSGPSLSKYQAKEGIAIAVNGAALCDLPYHLFICGDVKSPKRAWFYGSERYKAKRLISTFVAPYDKVLYPFFLTRVFEQSRVFLPTFLTKWKYPMDGLYSYLPATPPSPGHAIFKYTALPFEKAYQNIRNHLQNEEMLHGATISGVALQVALCLGAKTINFYGVTMDNTDGTNYFREGLTGGRSTKLQIDNFNRLVEYASKSGVTIKVF